MSQLSALFLAAAVTWNPPERFDYPYQGDMVVTSASVDNVTSICRMLVGRDKNVYYGCAVENNGICYVAMINENIDGITPSAVYRHEIGHCNGWPSTHSE